MATSEFGAWGSIHRQTVCKARERDYTFGEQCENARGEALAKLGTGPHELALGGDVRALMLLLRHDGLRTYSWKRERPGPGKTD